MNGIWVSIKSMAVQLLFTCSILKYTFLFFGLFWLKVLDDLFLVIKHIIYIFNILTKYEYFSFDEIWNNNCDGKMFYILKN